MVIVIRDKLISMREKLRWWPVIR